MRSGACGRWSGGPLTLAMSLAAFRLLGLSDADEVEAALERTLDGPAPRRDRARVDRPGLGARALGAGGAAVTPMDRRTFLRAGRHRRRRVGRRGPGCRRRDPGAAPPARPSLGRRCPSRRPVGRRSLVARRRLVRRRPGNHGRGWSARGGRRPWPAARCCSSPTWSSTTRAPSSTPTRGSSRQPCWPCDDSARPSVLVAEGPGHRRDTPFVVSALGSGRAPAARSVRGSST